MKTCPIQELCNHYTNGSKRRSHHIRLTDPCNHWLAMNCEKMAILAELTEYATGKVFACNISKIKRIKGDLK